MHVKKLYSATSLIAFLFYLLLRVACIALLVFCIYMYEENHFVFILLGIIAILTFMFCGEEEITLHEDRITQKTNSIISYLRKSAGKEIFINTIAKAYVEKKPTSTKLEFGLVLFLSVYFNSGRLKSTKATTIFFKLKSGAEEEIITSLSSKKVNEIVHNINVSCNPYRPSQIR